MLHPRDQWFVIYAYNPGKAGPVLEGPEPKEGEPDTRKLVAKWIDPPSWKPESDVEHVHHPNAYHPDPRICIAHHQKARAEGVTEAACGHVHDPRKQIVETNGKPVKPCGGCMAVTEAAKLEHAKARRELEAKAAEKRKVPEAPEADKVDP